MRRSHDWIIHPVKSENNPVLEWVRKCLFRFWLVILGWDAMLFELRIRRRLSSQGLKLSEDGTFLDSAENCLS